jgi:hypothetical protein
MAYRIQMSPHVREEVTVEDENGKELTVYVDLDVHQVLRQYTEAAEQLADAERQLRDLKKQGIDEENLGDAYAILGRAIIGLFAVVFGPEQTGEIVEFYRGNHTKMLADFVPFLQDVVVPKIREAQLQITRKYSMKSWKK